jgi:hypothetical protein
MCPAPRKRGSTDRRLPSRIAGTPAGRYCGLAKKPQRPKPIVWNVYKIASKAVWLGEIEAPDDTTAMEKVGAEFKVPANRLMAIRR